jgi:hypothetical protein
MIIDNLIKIEDREYESGFATNAVNVYNLDNAMWDSGLPMAAGLEDIIFANGDGRVKRCERLGSVKSGSGHDCFLKGILVCGIFTFKQAVWQQAKRYHWFDFISSMSTMHRITKMNLDNAFENTNVWGDTINTLKLKIQDYNECTDEAEKKEMFEEIVDNIPSGLLLPASITTNYLQLKTMYFQRRHHKLQQWRDFCDYVENLPMFREFVLNKE